MSADGILAQTLLVWLATQRKVEKWGHEEVRRWLGNVGLVHYEAVLKERGVQGLVRIPCYPLFKKVPTQAAAFLECQGYAKPGDVWPDRGDL